MRGIYMDHAATTPLDPAVMRVMQESMDVYGNPSSMHRIGREASRLLEESRERVAALIHAQPDEIVFHSGGTEGNNMVLKAFAEGRLHAKGMREGRHLITTRIEHASVLKPIEFLEAQGMPVTYLDVDASGMVSPERLVQAIRDETGMISVMAANNEVGTLQPIEAIGKIAREHGIFFHTDAVQRVGKLPVDVKAVCVDFLTLTGHKLYAPKGIGALYVREDVHVGHLHHGGHQERERRAGTENTLGIIALAKACELAAETLATEEARLSALTARMEQEIADRIEDVWYNGHPEHRLPGLLNYSFAGVEGEALMMGLDMRNVAVSTGSACTSEDVAPSHVLLAMGRSRAQARGSLRFSMGRFTEEQDAIQTVRVLEEVVHRLRSMSPMERLS